MVVSVLEQVITTARADLPPTPRPYLAFKGLQLPPHRDFLLRRSSLCLLECLPLCSLSYSLPSSPLSLSFVFLLPPSLTLFPAALPSSLFLQFRGAGGGQA